MKNFLIIAIPLVLLSAGAVAAILQPLSPKAATRAVTVVNSSKEARMEAIVAYDALLKQKDKTAARPVDCCGRCS